MKNKYKTCLVEICAIGKEIYGIADGSNMSSFLEYFIANYSYK